MENTVYLPDEAETLLIREITKRSFYRFVQEFWHTIISEEPSWNWHIKYLCDELQIVAERVFAKQPKAYDVLINISPGTTKCEVAGNPILTPNGYEELDLEDRVLSLGKDNNLFDQRIVSKGSYYADCVTLYSHLGEARTYSSNHPFLTQRGWVAAKDLTESDFVQVLCAKLPTNERIPDAELDFITLMLFEGCTVNKSRSITNYDASVIEIMRKACESLGLTLVSYEHLRKGWFSIRDNVEWSRKNFGKTGNKLGKTNVLLQKYGVHECLSKHKRLPPQFFAMPIDQKYRFVGLMIATDGFIDKYGTLRITLASHGLIQDIKRLLAGMGIMSTYRYQRVKYKNKRTDEFVKAMHGGYVYIKRRVKRFLQMLIFYKRQTKFRAGSKGIPANGTIR